MAAALDKTYDGIIIGAGQHGLVLGSYLAKAGLEILLVDRRLTYGGGLCTREVTEPGFYHNLHSINHFHISETPWFSDLNLARHGHLHHAALRIRPGASRRHRAGARPRSGGDARQHRALLQEGRADLPRLEPRAPRRSPRDILLPERYAEPLPQAEREALLSRTPIGREFLEVTQRQPLDVVEELFENEHVQAAVPVQGVAVRHLADRHHVEDQPDGLGDPRLRSGERLPALPGRLVQSGARADGDLHRRWRHVPAAGDDREDRDRRRQGHRHRAEPMAARCGRRNSSPSTLDVHQTFEKPDRPRATAGSVPQEARQFQVHRLDAVRRCICALHESPQLRGGDIRSEHQPRDEMDVSAPRRWRTCSRRIRTCRPAACRSWCNSAPGRLSLLDPTQAPPGKHTTYAWHVMPLSIPR